MRLVGAGGSGIARVAGTLRQGFTRYGKGKVRVVICLISSLRLAVFPTASSKVWRRVIGFFVEKELFRFWSRGCVGFRRGVSFPDFENAKGFPGVVVGADGGFEEGEGASGGGRVVVGSQTTTELGVSVRRLAKRGSSSGRTMVSQAIDSAGKAERRAVGPVSAGANRKALATRVEGRFAGGGTGVWRGSRSSRIARRRRLRGLRCSREGSWIGCDGGRH